ncbi:MAG TPA: TAT-variant-translocated molybdopterin oxidoreductase [Balneolales bacterium]|nr:TAT-variant-translocated molybdopterin oxidoreductase [Balneolales bacterium]
MSKKNETNTYWKSLNELSNNDEYKKFLDREFPEGASELKDGMTRKNFLRIMGASIALAGFAACRRPVEKILPYKSRPEEVVPGNPLFYATAMPYRGSLTGLLVETHEGRPTKIEGNTEHPASMGNTNTQMQGATLGLYDPDRSHGITQNGQKKTWNDFISFAKQNFTSDKKVAFLCEANSSMTLNRLKKDALKKFKNAEWVTYEPFGEQNALEGNYRAFGKKLRTFNRFNEANVIVSLDADFLQQGSEQVINIGNYAKRREMKTPNNNPNRLFVVENNYSLTGSNADHRLRVKNSEVELFTYALAAALADKVNGLEAFKGYSNSLSNHSWISVLTEELLKNKGKSIVVTGNDQNPAVHAAVAAINVALDNNDKTVAYYDVPTFDEGYDIERFYKLTSDLKAGKYDALVMIGTNPVFTAPSDLDFTSALKATKTTVLLSEYHDETARQTQWHVNRAHFLEQWGDGTSYTGVKSVIQPLILPLFDGKSEIEFLNTIVNGKSEKGHKLVRDTWKSYLPASNFEDGWEKVLNDGLLPNTEFDKPRLSIATSFAGDMKQAFAKAKKPSDTEIELVIKPDNKIIDGRYGNIGWLQELPDPVTKITWDNVALMSLKTAATLGVKNEDVVKIEAAGHTVTLAAWVLPGHADNSITIWAGYGRKGVGRIADDNFGIYTNNTYGTLPFKVHKFKSKNVFPFVTTDNPLYHSSVKVKKTGDYYPIASTQDHSSMEGRPLAREATIDEYRKDPHFAPEMEPVDGIEKKGYRKFPAAMFTPQKGYDYLPQWGMSVDLNACIGCGTCTIACQAENNIPIVGKPSVKRGREMHWIRTDRYFIGNDAGDPKVIHQPVPCMQCELAPCEEVCPVAATTHSRTGLNQQTYNRCIGTRYCLNNCPYKVRRFNFFNYTKEFLASGKDPEVIQMAMNPDVTVRFRGVMEKCTYCVQRLNRAQINRQLETKNQSFKPVDGSVQTACQQACPANAINFGDISDPNSKVVQTKHNDRNYIMLDVLNTRPRTSYLAKIRNPNPKLS